MKNWIAFVISGLILASGGFAAYELNDRWSASVVHAESQLGSPDIAVKEDAKPNLKEMIRESQKHVVSIEVALEDGTSLGSGFLYNDKGDVVTNAHVVTGALSVRVKTSDMSIHPGKVIGIDEEKDIAVVRVEALVGKEPMAVDKETKIEIGDQVMAFGSPLGLDNTVTTGIISGVDRDMDIDSTKYRGVYQISAPITHGNSGGPLVLESNGKVIGINSAGNDQGSIGFSIPYRQIAGMIEDWSLNPDEELAKQSSSLGTDAVFTTGYTKETFAADAQYIVQYFYESLSSGDYVSAYSVLGSDWQTKTTYEKFREGYLNTESVTVTSSSVLSGTEKEAQISATIEAWENRDEGTVLSKYSLTYKVKLENDMVKIISGKGKKL
ncbi:trypsin-like peptidase domain-containing protein [Cohnella sp. LGH]|uniref:S1C family serine protease n=1 Tax=Cohnella sp. LGH TaxID=1619153 RepID=UPI001ADA5350|nr:trypsin-like peptidase domain-containing protein [Cohnella sp. LGH]QTH44589.1 trypsin-like peptidase domain-containing protein [Cohnella sp. LGH]